MKKNYAIAIDIGASNLRVAIISNAGKIIRQKNSKTPKKGRSGKIVTDTIIDILNSLLINFNKSKIIGIGISSIGPLNHKTGEIVNPPNIFFKKVSIKEPIEKYFSLPVSIVNDCMAAAWAEKIFGAGKNYENLVYVTISSGIGAGVIANNQLLVGNSYNFADVGHFVVDTKYNLACNCAKGSGHWETYCSGENINNFFKHWLKTNKIKKQYSFTTAKEIYQEFEKKDKNVKNFIHETNQINSRGVANIIAAYDPEIIILGGAVTLNNKKIILSGIKNNLNKSLKTPKIIITPLAQNTPLLGAAAIVFFPFKTK